MIATFLRHLRPGYCTLVAINEAGQVTGATFDNPDQAEQWAIQMNQQRFNLYFTVNATQPGIGTKPKKAHITCCDVVWVDIDPDVANLGYEAARNQLLTQTLPVLVANPQPTVVDSGNGLAAYWRLVQSVSQEECEHLNKQLIAKFGGDVGTHNCDRIMRLPGTWNYKTKAGYPSEPTWAQVLAWDQGAYDAEALGQWLPEVERRALEDVPVREGMTSSPEVLEILSYLDPATLDYHQWKDVGMGLYHNYGGSAEGFQIWDEWSSQDQERYNASEMSGKWRTFHGDGITFGTVASMAQQLGADMRDIGLRHRAVAAFGGNGSEPPPQGGIMHHSHFPEMFKQYVYLEGPNEVYDGITGTVLSLAAFDARYGQYTFLHRPGDLSASTQHTRDASKALTRAENYRPTTARDMRFRPDLDVNSIFIEENGLQYVNSYRPVVVNHSKAAPSVEPFLAQVRTMLPEPWDAQVLIYYTASLVQNPGVKFQWCPLLIGAEGNGKTWYAELVAAMVGRQYTTRPRSRDISSQFNPYLDGNLLVLVEEASISRNAMDSIKVQITNDFVSCEKKGKDAIDIRNFANFILTSNDDDAVAIQDDNRRISVLKCAQMTAEDVARDFPDPDYWTGLFRWSEHEGGMEAVYDYLVNLPIPDELNPATQCRRAPRTTTTAEVVESSRSAIEQRIAEAIENEDIGFRGGMVSHIKVGEIAQALGWKVIPGPKKCARIMRKLGYVIHPLQMESRCRLNNRVMAEGGKPCIYVRSDLVAMMEIPTNADLKHRYEQLQGYIPQDDGDYPYVTPDVGVH